MTPIDFFVRGNDIQLQFGRMEEIIEEVVTLWEGGKELMARGC